MSEVLLICYRLLTCVIVLASLVFIYSRPDTSSKLKAYDKVDIVHWQGARFGLPKGWRVKSKLEKQLILNESRSSVEFRTIVELDQRTASVERLMREMQGIFGKERFASLKSLKGNRIYWNSKVEAGKFGCRGVLFLGRRVVSFKGEGTDVTRIWTIIHSVDRLIRRTEQNIDSDDYFVVIPSFGALL